MMQLSTVIAIAQQKKCCIGRGPHIYHGAYRCINRPARASQDLHGVKHQLAHRCSLCENFHTYMYMKCEVET